MSCSEACSDKINDMSQMIGKVNIYDIYTPCFSNLPSTVSKARYESLTFNTKIVTLCQCVDVGTLLKIIWCLIWVTPLVIMVLMSALMIMWRPSTWTMTR